MRLHLTTIHISSQNAIKTSRSVYSNHQLVGTEITISLKTHLKVGWLADPVDFGAPVADGCGSFQVLKARATIARYL